jgi:mannose-6-phosphate isomerase-like protein (cupin superfamily)
MKSRYQDLQTGELLSAKQLLASETGDEVWKAADEMHSFLANMAEKLEAESQEQLLQASIIRGYLKKYDDALDLLDEGEGRHLVPESQSLPESQGFAHVLPDEGKAFWFAGELYTAKAVGEDTSWSFTLLEALSPPGGGPLPHIHYREDETFYVLEGELEFMVEGNPIKVGAGSCLYVRKGTLHTYSNVGTQPARYLGVLAPAGIERFFEEVGVPAIDRSSPPPFEQEDLEGLLATAPKFGLEIKPPY